MRYADAGVDISRAEQAKDRIRRVYFAHLHARRSRRHRLIWRAFSLSTPNAGKEPVLVSSADGVGTKLKVAAATGIHSTVGADLVNHCVNDILDDGRGTLVFLDYLAMSRMDPEIVEQLVEGMTRACHDAGCALIGGETAELPDTYAAGEYDLAGFIVGVVERSRIMKAGAVPAGDLLIALPSLGLNTQRLFAGPQAYL